MDIQLLETPPNSPGALLTLDDLPSPEPDYELAKLDATVYAVISPQKKPRKPGAVSRKRRRSLTPCLDHAGAPEGIDLSPLQPFLPMTDLLGNGLTSITTSLSDFDHAGTDRDDYYVYIESVTSFVSGFFQISETVFIVQGWDRKRESATVEC